MDDRSDGFRVEKDPMMGSVDDAARGKGGGARVG
jgi:hypothetical protein